MAVLKENPVLLESISTNADSCVVSSSNVKQEYITDPVPQLPKIESGISLVKNELDESPSMGEISQLSSSRPNEKHEVVTETAQVKQEATSPSINSNSEDSSLEEQSNISVEMKEVQDVGNGGISLQRSDAIVEGNERQCRVAEKEPTPEAEAYCEAGDPRRHVKAHYDDGRYTCEVCSREFKARLYLQRHLRDVHTDAKPFSCHLCSSTFKRLSCLNRHIRIIHRKDKPFACSLCSQVYAKPSGLKRHMETHSDEKPYICPLCPKAFKCKTYVRQHVQVVHSLSIASSCEPSPNRSMPLNLHKQYGTLRPAQGLNNFSQLPEQRDRKNESDKEAGLQEAVCVESPSRTQDKSSESQVGTCSDTGEGSLHNGSEVIWIKNEVSLEDDATNGVYANEFVESSWD